MIIIEKPEIKIEGNTLKYVSRFQNNGKTEILWFSLPGQYEKFIVTENLDASLVGLLFLALSTGQDIHLKGTVSARLYYTLNHYLIDALCLANSSFKKISITAASLNTQDLNVGNTAGTGLSGGVDSFATYYDHKEDKKPYKIEYLTYLNVGSHGDFGGENSRKLFEKRMMRVRKFAEKEGVDFLPIDSNLSEILNLNFQKTHTLRSISCVLLLQKLFRNYYYASSLRFDRFKLSKERIAEYDLLNLHMLSTESTSLFSTIAHLTRVDRIGFIANYSSTHHFLDVCTQSGGNENDKVNCSRCPKCIRTMLTLEILGYLNYYDEVFDLPLYMHNRSRYIGELLFKSKKETLDLELLDLMRSRKIKTPLISYYYGLKAVSLSQKSRLKRYIKSKEC